jgi:nitroreductase
MSVKDARTDHEIHELLTRRWSPYAFDERPVAPSDLAALFEAARWTASSYNEQPWRYLVAQRDDEPAFARLLSCLVEANQAWARRAPVLALGLVSTRFARNDKPNAAARHDLGAASAQLTLEATRRGLSVHQMIGIDPPRAKELYGLPDGVEAVTGLAIGYVAPTEALPEALRERDRTPRTRRPQAEWVFEGEWERPARWSSARSE